MRAARRATRMSGSSVRQTWRLTGSLTPRVNSARRTARRRTAKSLTTMSSAHRCDRRNAPWRLATVRIRRRLAGALIPPTESRSSSSRRRSSPVRSSSGIDCHGSSRFTSRRHTEMTNSTDVGPHRSRSNQSRSATPAYRAAVIRSPPALMANSARRFRLQHDSSCSLQTGRSSPLDAIAIRLESIPRSVR